MPLIHLPVQSGSNKILEAMNRKHTIEEYLGIIEKLKKVNTSIKFSSDFIIGYPGESLQDFKKTEKLIKEVKYINSYSFVFSARPGTPAYKLKEFNQSETKKRLISFQNTAEKIKIKFRETLIGKISDVLIENKTKDGKKYFGRDEYSNSVIVKSNESLVGKIKKIKITSGNHNTLYGETLSNLNQNNFAA